MWSDQTVGMKTTKGSRAQRYQPATGFDDATLAQKREYWRTKKREQRARRAVVKRTARETNAGICQSTHTMPDLGSTPRSIGVSIQMLHSESSPPLHISNSSLQPDEGCTLLNAAKSDFSPPNLTNRQGYNLHLEAKKRWFHGIKLKNVLPQNTTQSTQSTEIFCNNEARSLNSTVTHKCEDDGLTKPNEALLINVSQVPVEGLQVLQNSTLHPQTTSQMSSSKGNSLAVSRQSFATLRSRYNENHKMQVEDGIPCNQVTSKDEKLSMHQFIPGRASTWRKICTTAPGTATHVPKTEEERVAKRRENWRIKKREQRAKRAAQLVKDKAGGLRDGVQVTGQISCTVFKCSSTPLSSKSVRVPQQHSLMSANVSPSHCILGSRPSSNPEYTYEAIKNKPNIFIPPKPTAVGNNCQFVTLNTEQCRDSPGTFNSAPSTNIAGHTPNLKEGHVPTQSLGNTRWIDWCKTRRQRFMDSQRMFGKMKSGQAPSLVAVLPCGNVSRLETAEEKLARRREYWRIKKREQRAKLSVERKAKMKEREALMRRAKRYQAVLEQLRRVRSGSLKAREQTRNMHASASETIGGFIKEDGTVTSPIPQPSLKTHLSVESCSMSIESGSQNPGCHLQVKAPSAQEKVHFQGATSPADKGGSKYLSLVNVKSRPVIHNVQSNRGNLLKCVPNHLHPTSACLNTTGTGSPPQMVWPAEELSEVERIARRREYWRIKKREQRASRAARVRQGVLQGRVIGMTHKCQHQRPTRPRSSVAPKPITYADCTRNNECSSLSGLVSVSPPPGDQGEMESSAGADTQATTLLVVASMKKLLEESLSNVAECNPSSPVKSDPLSSKTKEEPPDDTCEDVKPEFICLDHHGVENASLRKGTPPPEVKPSPPLSLSIDCTFDSSPNDHLLNQAPSLNPVSSQAHSTTSTHALPLGQEPSAVCRLPPANPPSSQSRAPRPLAKRVRPSPLQAGRAPQANESSILQREREYWRFTKRRQRARKAWERKDQRDTVEQMKKRAISAVIPTFNNRAMRGQTKLPSATGFHGAPISATTLPMKSCDNPRARPATSRHPSCAPPKPPPNNLPAKQCLQPCGVSAATCQGPQITRPSDRQGNSGVSQPSRQNSHGPSAERKETFGPRSANPPKVYRPAEKDAEDVLRRRREYWRVKKKEQRAKKAAERQRELGQWVEPAPWTCPLSDQDASHWQDSSHDKVALLSTPADVEFGYCPDQSQTGALKDEGDLGVIPDEGSGFAGSVSEAEWRDIYLMDFDPLHQLLVCMVCGEQQYSLCVEGVRAHIEEVHPDTLTLDPGERQRLLQAWDEQVSLREQFFSNQLQQHVPAPAEQGSSLPAEVEVTVDEEDSKLLKTCMHLKTETPWQL